MTCRTTGRRPRKQRVTVAPGPPHWLDLLTPAPDSDPNYHRVPVDDSRQPVGPALMAAGILGILASILCGGLYVVAQIARAVWS